MGDGGEKRRCPQCGVVSKSTLTDECHGCGAPEYGYVRPPEPPVSRVEGAMAQLMVRMSQGAVEQTLEVVRHSAHAGEDGEHCVICQWEQEAIAGLEAAILDPDGPSGLYAVRSELLDRAATAAHVGMTAEEQALRAAVAFVDEQIAAPRPPSTDELSLPDAPSVVDQSSSPQVEGETCPGCGGSGHATTPNGYIAANRECPDCGGPSGDIADRVRGIANSDLLASASYWRAELLRAADLLAQAANAVSKS